MAEPSTPGAPPSRALPAERRFPAPDRFGPDHRHFEAAMAAHDRAVELGTFGYRDPSSGLLVLTAVYLWERGVCCDTGCRHCPYAARPGAEDLVASHRI